jgi:hypothetical protein
MRRDLEPGCIDAATLVDVLDRVLDKGLVVGGRASCRRDGHARRMLAPVERGASLIDVLDRVLDKGIVIDAWVRARAGIDLGTVAARLVVASNDTRLDHAPCR